MMRKFARMRVFLLALMLAASHIALASHVTAHFSPNLEKCELCVSHAQLLTAVPTADANFPVDPGYRIPLFDTPGLTVPERRAIAHRQRAPPLPSA
jgi:hypothetical protein